MSQYIKQVEIRWSDLDPNFHVRHSVYYDFGAYIRMCCLTDLGLTVPVLLKHNLGPILFREECVFRKEIQFGDRVSISFKLKKCTPNASRWTIAHEIIKNENTLSAIVTVDGAWMDTEKRKLTAPPSFVIDTFKAMPKEEGIIFEVVE